MRRLVPDPADDVDLDASYAWPRGADPMVRANMVASADGAAWLSGVTTGLSSPADRRVLTVLRGLADVVLVGAGTVRLEDLGPAQPSDARREHRTAEGRAPVPPIAVVSSRLDLDATARLFEPGPVRPILLTTERAPADRRMTLSTLADVVVAGDQVVDLPAALAALAARGLRRVLCEGGPTLLAAVMAADRLDELCLTIAPCLVAGAAGRVLTGPALPAPGRLELRHVLEEAGSLFLRYAVPKRPPVSSSVPPP